MPNTDTTTPNQSFASEEAAPKSPNYYRERRGYAHTDSGNAELFAGSYKDILRYDHAARRWLVWREHWWTTDQDAEVIRLAKQAARLRGRQAAEIEDEGLQDKARKWAKQSEALSRLKAALELAQAEPELKDDGTRWDSNSMLLGLKNGVLDLTGFGDFTPITQLNPVPPCIANCTPPMDTLFSDLGPPGNVYQCCNGWPESGARTEEGSVTAANRFTPVRSGSISQIDLGIGFVNPPPVNTLNVSIWTDNSGLPGTQVAGASWNNLAATQPFGRCCGLLTISPISGVTLTGGQSYFMIVGPVSLSDLSWNKWNWNSQGLTGLDLYSTDGGITWNSNGSGNPLGAFDVLGGGTTRSDAISKR